MTDTRTDTPSVAERTRPVKAEAPIVAAHFLGHAAVFVLGEEALLLVPREGDVQRLPVHGGAILASAADAERVVVAIVSAINPHRTPRISVAIKGHATQRANLGKGAVALVVKNEVLHSIICDHEIDPAIAIDIDR